MACLPRDSRFFAPPTLRDPCPAFRKLRLSGSDKSATRDFPARSDSIRRYRVLIGRRVEGIRRGRPFAPSVTSLPSPSPLLPSCFPLIEVGRVLAQCFPTFKRFVAVCFAIPSYDWPLGVPMFSLVVPVVYRVLLCTI